MFAPGIALGHVTGRLGCFAAGCCYGRPTDVPWGVIFTDPLAAANVGTPLGIRLHPTQLYEAGAELLILAFLLATERRGRPFPGRTFWLYMFLYAVSRYVIEIYRGDPRGVVPFLGISTSQFISRDPRTPQPDHVAVAVARAADRAAGSPSPPTRRGLKCQWPATTRTAPPTSWCPPSSGASASIAF